jgi:biofilm PGA synthesis N-glycosyltransferase PgaC
VTATLIGFFIFWGIWLFVPLLIDGTTAASYFWGAWRYERKLRRKREAFQLAQFPTVALIVPVRNGEAYLANCLRSIRGQTYPQDRLHVIVVDNQSADRTQEVFQEEQAQPFEGRMDIISLAFKGKAWALNAGIHMSASEFICNVDSDTVLKEDAIYNMVRAFVHDPTLAAATGTIDVLPLEGENIHPLRRAMSAAEYVEYYVAFRIGREYQSVTNSLFTLAGAFSFFRREVLLQTSLYTNLTVSEDTNLTFEVHERFPNMRVMTVAEAVAYVEPAPSLGALYSQRVRWQRGELEVMALYPKFLRHPLRLKGLSSVKSLLVDHTLAFPRVVWTFLFPLMYFMGYPLRLVVSATLTMYLAYLVFDALYMLVGYALADRDSRQRLRKVWWAFAVLPAFRYITFWFRFGGFLEVLMEPPQWRVRSPWAQTADGLLHLRAAAVSLIAQVSQSKLVSMLVHLLRGG